MDTGIIICNILLLFSSDSSTFSDVTDASETVVVSVETNVKHPIYSKIVKRTYNLKAHDEENACQIGDKVKVMETRPLSKDKRFRVVEIVEKAVIK